MDSRIQNMTFGVELELHLPRGTSVHDVCRTISQAIGKPCLQEAYSHLARSYWKVITDMSLTGLNSWEFISPPLSGDAGLAEVKLVMELLVNAGATVGSDCGTHVHVGVGSRNPDLNMVKRALKAYMVFEPAIDTIQPRSRRANNARLITTTTHFSIAAIDRARTLGELFQVMTNTRYHKFNIQALLRHPTLEFRHHSGTLEFPKLSNWIHFCLRYIAAAMDGTIAVPMAEGGAPQVNRARYGSKSWQIGNLLLRAEGCTAQEVMRAVGWPSVSMVQQARICGLQLVRQRQGRNVRFYARGMSTSTTIQSGPATLDRLLTIIGASASEREFYAARAAHFAARQAA